MYLRYPFRGGEGEKGLTRLWIGSLGGRITIFESDIARSRRGSSIEVEEASSHKGMGILAGVKDLRFFFLMRKQRLRHRNRGGG